MNEELRRMLLNPESLFVKLMETFLRETLSIDRVSQFQQYLEYKSAIEKKIVTVEECKNTFLITAKKVASFIHEIFHKTELAPNIFYTFSRITDYIFDMFSNDTREILQEVFTTQYNSMTLVHLMLTQKSIDKSFIYQMESFSRSKNLSREFCEKIIFTKNQSGQSALDIIAITQANFLKLFESKATLSRSQFLEISQKFPLTGESMVNLLDFLLTAAIKSKSSEIFNRFLSDVSSVNKILLRDLFMPYSYISSRKSVFHKAVLSSNHEILRSAFNFILDKEIATLAEVKDQFLKRHVISSSTYERKSDNVLDEYFSDISLTNDPKLMEMFPAIMELLKKLEITYAEIIQYFVEEVNPYSSIFDVLCFNKKEYTKIVFEIFECVPSQMIRNLIKEKLEKTISCLLHVLDIENLDLLLSFLKRHDLLKELLLKDNVEILEPSEETLKGEKIQYKTFMLLLIHMKSPEAFHFLLEIIKGELEGTEEEIIQKIKNDFIDLINIFSKNEEFKNDFEKEPKEYIEIICTNINALAKYLFKDNYERIDMDFFQKWNLPKIILESLEAKIKSSKSRVEELLENSAEQVLETLPGTPSYDEASFQEDHQTQVLGENS